MIRVETETETPFKVDASGAVTNQLETAPVRTMTHYFDDASGRNEGHLGGIEVDGATTTVVGPKWPMVQRRQMSTSLRLRLQI